LVRLKKSKTHTLKIGHARDPDSGQYVINEEFRKNPKNHIRILEVRVAAMTTHFAEECLRMLDEEELADY